MPNGASFGLRLRHVSLLCVTGTALTIAVDGSDVVEASRHLLFLPVGVVRYLLAGSGSTAGARASAAVSARVPGVVSGRSRFAVLGAC